MKDITGKVLDDKLPITISMMLSQWASVNNWLSRLHFAEVVSVYTEIRKQLSGIETTENVPITMSIEEFNVVTHSLSFAPYNIVADCMHTIMFQGSEEIEEWRKAFEKQESQKEQE
jgi:hypothetical protein